MTNDIRKCEGNDLFVYVTYKLVSEHTPCVKLFINIIMQQTLWRADLYFTGGGGGYLLLLLAV